MSSINEYLHAAAAFNPVWDSARTALDTNYYVVEVPAKYLKRLGFGIDSNGRNVNGLTRLLVLKSKKYGSMSAVLMQIHGDAGVAVNDVHYMAVPQTQTFSGQIFFTTVQGLFMNGYFYKNGKVTLASIPIAASAAKPTGPQIMEINGQDQDCWLFEIYHYTADCYDYGSYIQCGEWTIEYTESYIFCTPISGGGGGTVPPPLCLPGSNGGNGGNNGGGNNGGQPITTMSLNGKLRVSQAQQPDPGDGGGDNDDPYAPTSNCTPVVDSAATEYAIKNHVKDTCLHKMVDSTISKNVINNINTLVQGVFGNSDKMNIEFVDTKDLANGYDGYTESNGGLQNGNLNIQIQLNSNYLQNYSQEYIARVIMHEAIHAYLVAKGIPDELQHENMAVKYVTQMSAVLQQMFPKLTDADAKNLSLGGLQFTTTFEDTVANHIELDGQWRATSLAYSIGSKGHRCN